MIFSTPQINPSPLGLGRVVKPASHMAAGSMKGAQLSDNLFSAGLSVNHVDSISRDLMASGCARSLYQFHIRGCREREMEKKYCRGKRWREVNNCRSLYCMIPAR